MGIRHIINNTFAPSSKRDSVLEGKSVEYLTTSRTGGGSIFASGDLNVGGIGYRVTEVYRTIPFNTGDFIISNVSTYYTFKLSGASGGQNGVGGVTVASVYMVRGEPLYIRSFASPYARTGGSGLYLGTVNELQPVSDRPSSTILVAGGSGFRLSKPIVGAGGGLNGGSGRGERTNGQPDYIVPGGQQTSGGTGSFGGTDGEAWYGGVGAPGTQGWGPGAGGGNGWYGGGSTGGDFGASNHGSGGGGSGYVTGVLTSPATHGHISPLNASTTAGIANTPSSDKTATKLEVKLGPV